MSRASSHRPGSLSALRGANRERVLDALSSGEAITQADLARRTGLAPATISNIVRDLQAGGCVAVRAAGRRREVRLTPASGLIGAVDFGHRHVTVALGRQLPEVLVERRADLEPSVTAAKGMAVARRLLEAALAEVNASVADLTGVGMGLPAPIDNRTGEVGSPSILPGWVGVEAAALGRRILGVPVVVDNDANLAALAEYRWGGFGVENLAYLKLSDGVGAGLIIDGELFSGPKGTAGEIGHTTVNEFGAVCRCGNRGCLETVISARAVLSLLTPLLGPDLTVGNMVERALAGDHACARVLEDTGTQVGHAVAGLCNVLNPELVVIGGELAQAASLLVPSIHQVVIRCGIPSAAREMTITTGGLGPRAHVLGGLALVQRQMVSEYT